MARTVGNEEERERRIKLVGEYRVQTGASTREIAEYFSKTQFSISNYTVDSYIKEYKKMYPLMAKIIDAQTYDNLSDSIKKPEVVSRVFKVANLIKSGITIEEIANNLNEAYWIIYRDIHNRLPILDKNLYDEVCAILNENSKGNRKKEK